MLRDRSREIYRVRWLILLAALGVQVACTKADDGELQWARSALERNPQIKVLSVDTAKNTIQVRMKSTGETFTLTPGELAAIPIGDLVALSNASRATPPVVAAPGPTPTPPVEERAPIAAAAMPAEEVPVPEPAKPEYKVERQDGQVHVTGPGVSIETHRPTAQATTAAASQRYDEPIICDGKRMLHLDNRHLNIDGDAIIARGGCELYITNSHIKATGTAVTVLDATVHIANSEMQGSEGSLTTSSAAHAYVRNSKFTGLARRDPQAAIQDQGGNTWR